MEILPSGLLSLDELFGRLHHLARAYPEQVRLLRYGRSRQGEELLALQLGGGPRRILAYAFPQPDEPLGGAVILHLVHLLLEDPGLCEQASWTLLPCVDPDGARRNAGWFARPLDLRSYAQQHFRPPEGEQVEWSFPSADPAWSWHCSLPETSALQAVLDRVRPQTLFPLHNALIGGAYAFLGPGWQDLAASIPALWQARGLPTHHGQPELPFTARLATGVYRLPELAEIRAALSSQGVADPAGLLQCGAPAYLYARRGGDVSVLVPELPLFVVPGIANLGPADVTRRQLLRTMLAKDRAAFSQWADYYQQAVSLLAPDNPYRSALENHHRSTVPLLEATARWVETDPALEERATVAETVDALEIAPYLRLLPLGMLLQGLQVATAGGRASRTGLSLSDQVRSHLQGCLDEALSVLEAVPVPTGLLVEVAAEMILLTLRASQNGQHMV